MKFLLLTQESDTQHQHEMSIRLPQQPSLQCSPNHILPDDPKPRKPSSRTHSTQSSLQIPEAPEQAQNSRSCYPGHPGCNHARHLPARNKGCSLQGHTFFLLHASLEYLKQSSMKGVECFQNSTHLDCSRRVTLCLILFSLSQWENLPMSSISHHDVFSVRSTVLLDFRGFSLVYSMQE